jgi:hypothetical protein
MPGMIEVRDAAVAAIAAALPGTRCAAFDGSLTVEGIALKRLSKAGAVFVACLGAVNTAGENSLDLTMSLALGSFCISQNAAGRAGREADALPLAQAVVGLVHGSTFGLAGVGPGRVAEVDNELTVALEKDLDMKGISVWVVTWSHQIIF